MPIEYHSEAVVFDREPSGDLARVRVEHDPLRIAFDAYGRVFAADDRGVESLSKVRAEGERYFGCGERTSGAREDRFAPGVLERRSASRVTRQSFNNLYTSIPFVLSLQRRSSHTGCSSTIRGASSST